MKTLTPFFFLMLGLGCAYQHEEQHLEVIAGEGTGYYLPGQTVEIFAHPPQMGKVFALWKGDTSALSLDHEPETQFLMPNRDLKLEATYKDAPPVVRFRTQIRPIFRSYCSETGCHDAQSQIFPLLTYQNIAPRASAIRGAVESRRMPLGNTLPAKEMELLLEWIDQGAMDN